MNKIKNLIINLYLKNLNRLVSGRIKKSLERKLIFESTEEFLKYVKLLFFDDMNIKTKKGNSNERISDGIFERIGFVTKVLREEDYGIDYLCSVGRETETSIYPTKSFVVQLKSNFDEIVYDLTNVEKNRWLLENNLPLFFCVYVENEGNLFFYSSSMINDFNIRKYRDIEKIKFTFRPPNDELCAIDIHSVLKTEAKSYDIDCGIPFLKISVLETLADNPKEFNNYRDILEKVVRKENENIVYRNIGLPFFSWLHQYKTNSTEIIFGWADYSDDCIIKGDELLNILFQQVLTLCNTYFHEKQNDKFMKLRYFVDLIDYNDKTKSVLEVLGYRDKQGRIINKQIDE
ncbi:MAG: hypothetical protein AB7S48_06520 [Bacteroidales bacterium]